MRASIGRGRPTSTISLKSVSRCVEVRFGAHQLSSRRLCWSNTDRAGLRDRAWTSYTNSDGKPLSIVPGQLGIYTGEFKLVYLGLHTELVHSNFTFVAEHFGCVNLSAQEEVKCLQKVHWKKIIDLYEDDNLNHSTGQLKWTTVVVNITRSGNYTKRTLAGKHNKLPAIEGGNANEEASLITWLGTAGPTMTYVHEESFSVHICPGVHHTSLRYQSDSLTFFYFNTANFSNISPRPWVGAYHTSELPLLFAIWQDYGCPGTSFEAAVSAHWQDLYLESMKDPVHGLPPHGKVAQLMPMSKLTNECAGIPETYELKVSQVVCGPHSPATKRLEMDGLPVKEM